MDILIICLLILAAVVLFLVELFVVPGISLAGILAGVCAVLGNYYARASSPWPSPPWPASAASSGSCAPRRWTGSR